MMPPERRRGLRGGRGRDDAGAPAIFAEALVDDRAVDQREERVVAPHADVGTRVHARAALADEDVARAHALAGVDLDAAPLAGAVTPVAGAALTFFVRH